MTSPAPDAASPHVRANPLLLALLAAFSAAAPAATQMFLPALPHVQQDFNVSVGVAQLALSVALFSAAVIPLLSGSWSDRFGRRPMASWGAALFVTGSIVCLFAPNIATLIAGRALQAGAGATGIVLSRAIVQDVFGAQRAASMVAVVTMAMGIAPMITPLIGGLLTDAFGWRSTFVFIGAFGAILLVMIVSILKETRPEQVGPRPRLAQSMLALLRLPLFHVYALQSAFTMGMFFAFISAAPYVVVNILKQPATVYGAGFLVISLGYIGGSAFAAKYSRRFGIDRMVFWGTLASLAAIVLMTALLFGGVWSVWAIFAPGALSAFAIGASMPNASAAVTAVYPPAAGSAAGLSSFLQLFVGAVTAQAVGTAIGATPYPMVLVMLAMGVLAFIAIAVRPLIRTPAVVPA